MFPSFHLIAGRVVWRGVERWIVCAMNGARRREVHPIKD